ncbi:MAG TPA: GGDEF domain-containing protein [Bauldia sp.]|nr:GGDEF domain-containing protein [Bauldia sp.]
MILRFFRHPVFITAVATAAVVVISYSVTCIALRGAGVPFPTVALELVLGLPAAVTPVLMLPLLISLRHQRRLRVELERMVHTDVLTGLPNRRAFFSSARDVLAVEAPPATPVVAMMIDVDHFKRVNDSYGHDVGDTVLKRVAGVIRDEVARAANCARWTVARLGGEEFAVLAEGLAPSAVARLADRICAQVHRWVGAGDSLEPVTVSIGVAFRAPAMTVDRLLKAADDAVYAAKANGRDRWAFAGDARNEPRRRQPRALPEPANDRVAVG